MRLAHGLVRSAVYQDIPLESRRELHLRAASILNGTAQVFEHRIAAALSYDERLAEDLERYADELRERLDFSAAARFLRCASRVTSDPVIREQRWLESLVDSAAHSDFALIRGERDALEQAQDRRRADLVLGLLAISGDWRPQEGVRLLEPWSGGEHTDLCQYRIEGMLAWARMTSDVDDEQIRIALDRAAALPAPDSWVVRLVMLTWSQLMTRHTPDLLALPVLATLPTDPKLAPIPATGVLAWRGHDPHRPGSARPGHCRPDRGDRSDSTRVGRVQLGLVLRRARPHAVVRRRLGSVPAELPGRPGVVRGAPAPDRRRRAAAAGDRRRRP